MKTFKDLFEAKIQDVTKKYKHLSKQIENVKIYPEAGFDWLTFTFVGPEETLEDDILKVLPKIVKAVKKDYDLRRYVEEPENWGKMHDSKGLHAGVKFMVED